MTSLGENYEKLMKFIRFFVNRAPVSQGVGTISQKNNSYFIYSDVNLITIHSFIYFAQSAQKKQLQ